jgi:hypothetical protein
VEDTKMFEMMKTVTGYMITFCYTPFANYFFYGTSEVVPGLHRNFA